MSDRINHECGIALVRLLKPLSYYQEKYGSPLWGFTKLFLLMEKQHNRGQDGAGVACVKLDMPAGVPFMFRERNIKSNPLHAPGPIQRPGRQRDDSPRVHQHGEG
jgi:amidophosphoribosyltransferase